MAVRNEIDRTPAQFTQAVAEIRQAVLRPEVVVDEMPAPQRIAPHAFAMSGDVIVDDDELATGRFILLHDPAGNDAWNGTFRCVTFARAEIDADMAADPVLSSVGWSWLTEALDAYGSAYSAASGSVTVVRSDGFGEMEADGSSAQIEVRASWTPEMDRPGGDTGGHAAAWSNLLCAIAGLPPLAPGVIPLQRRRGPR
ncbi:DUF3000 domain-containing protein [Aeromicrobium wangtongii]|uniref:DUF3000 domain-containing protein n=1 Tax=Aeromicrobium wangtongii TaxID=2969247 RepID=A0ABY5M480_9ACTN|nr:DUF3000 domain-containing protein [Aeromicrobium wangtongii]MCD9198252.1 DUF3000 domain-containing protein [Aeromicrobium wangtongii]UUP12287.1 DUF3000 domain-containing protein [Aeromicrobium wangtongii]